LFQRESQLSCYVCHLIFAVYPPDINASPTGNLERIGRHGRKKSTGINTSPDMRKKNAMIRKRGNSNQAGAGAKENTAIRS
jgi:hypothetical protein